MKQKSFRHHLVIAAFALSLITTAFAPAQTVEAAAKKPAQVKSVNVKAVGKTAKVTWKKAKNTKTYQVNIALDKKFKKSKKTYNTKVTNKTIGGLKAGKKYFVRVRAKGKSYGKWSTVRVFTVKKAVAKKTTSTTPTKPTSCQHSWKYDVNLDSMAHLQRCIAGCGTDITDIYSKIYHGATKTAVINGRTITWTADNYSQWGLEWYGPDYDIPCIACHKYCGIVQIKTTDNIDDLDATDHTKRTCTKCGKVEISGKDFTNGEVTYE